MLLTARHSLLLGDGDHTAQPLDSAHEVDQGGDVVGAHVHHGAAAVLVEELGIGMPALGASAHHEGRSPHDLPDSPLVDELTAGLDARAQEGVGCAADHKTALLRQLHQLHALLPGSPQRLFGVDVLPRQQSGLGDLVVLVGAGEIQHDIHLGIGEQLVHIFVELGDTVLLDGRFGALTDQIAHADDLDPVKHLGNVLQIDAGDASDAYDTDLFHGVLPQSSTPWGSP